jgi:hypothetical protein
MATTHERAIVLNYRSFIEASKRDPLKAMDL